jgi:hypothetical protein
VTKKKKKKKKKKTTRKRRPAPPPEPELEHGEDVLQFVMAALDAVEDSDVTTEQAGGWDAVEDWLVLRDKAGNVWQLQLVQTGVGGDA